MTDGLETGRRQQRVSFQHVRCGHFAFAVYGQFQPHFALKVIDFGQYGIFRRWARYDESLRFPMFEKGGGAVLLSR
jgi:hypothetical protein